jgi:hypothetical protein
MRRNRFHSEGSRALGLASTDRLTAELGREKRSILFSPHVPKTTTRVA